MALYDPNEIPTETVTPDFTLVDVLAWARTKPADEAYYYWDNMNCGIAQFGRETGRSHLIGLDLPPDSVRRFLNDNDMTFGGLVDRLEKTLSK